MIKIRTFVHQRNIVMYGNTAELARLPADNNRHPLGDQLEVKAPIKGGRRLQKGLVIGRKVTV